MLLLDRRQDIAFGTEGQGIGQILLDRHRCALGVMREVHDGKPAERNLSLDAVLVELIARRQRMIYLRDSHGMVLGGLQNRSERTEGKARGAQEPECTWVHEDSEHREVT